MTRYRGDPTRPAGGDPVTGGRPAGGDRVTGGRIDAGKPMATRRGSRAHDSGGTCKRQGRAGFTA